MIKEFKDKYAFLSNFYDSPFALGYHAYQTVEHYFQSKKADNELDEWQIIIAKTPGEAKKLGRLCSMVSNWDEIKDEIMYAGLQAKFSIPDLRAALLATGNEELQEGNWWGDKYWGVDLKTGIGQNKLGKMLMKLRKEIRENA